VGSSPSSFVNILFFKRKIKMNFDNKNIDRIIKVIIFSGQANIEPPLGPILVQYGINSLQFCKEFNEETSYIFESIPLTVNIILYKNKTYKFYYESTTTTYLISRSLCDSGITVKDLYFSTFYKNQNNKIRKILLRNFVGTCKSMNIYII
jgi:ribosomal protein L11